MPKQQSKKSRVNKTLKKVNRLEKRILKKTKPIRRPKRLGFGNILKEVGGGVGSLLGMPALGRLAGSTIGRVFGSGDYRVATNSDNSSTNPPTFAPLGSGFRISHREYLGDVLSSTGFSINTYLLQPGMTGTFPWLAGIANNFEQYKIHGCLIYLKTNTGSAISSTNANMGIWGVVTQYDVNEPTFATKQQCENYMGCTAVVPFRDVMHGIECKASSEPLKTYFVRDGSVGVADPKFYDQSKFHVFVQGQQASGNNLGELWISYDIEFLKPRLPTGGVNTFSDRFFIPTGSLTGVSPFGPNTVANQGSIGSSFIGSLNRLSIPITIPNGTYFLALRWSGTVPTNWAPPTITFSPGLTAASFWQSSPTTYGSFAQTPNNGANVQICQYNQTFTKVAQSGDLYLEFSAMTLPTGCHLNGFLTLLDPSTAPLISTIPKKRFTLAQRRLLAEILMNLKEDEVPEVKELLELSEIKSFSDCD